MTKRDSYVRARRKNAAAWYANIVKMVKDLERARDKEYSDLGVGEIEATEQAGSDEVSRNGVKREETLLTFAYQFDFGGWHD